MDRIMGKSFFALVVVLMAVMLPGMAFAGACPANSDNIVPDGRVMLWAVSNTTDLYGHFRAIIGKSYCIEAQTNDEEDDIDTFSLNGVGTCGSDLSIAANWYERDSYPPYNGYSLNVERWCGIASTSANVYYRFTTSTGTTALFSVSETTLFNPRWSTYNGFLSSWGFQNTTTGDINGVLTLDDGINTYTKTLLLPAGKLTYVFSNDAALALGADKAGCATFAHDGPPGGVRGDCYYAKSGVMIPSTFEPVRQNNH